MSEKKQSIGAFWSKTAKSGLKFYYGYVELGGQKYDLVMFVNDNRKDQQPTFRILESEPLDKNANSTVQQQQIQSVNEQQVGGDVATADEVVPF